MNIICVCGAGTMGSGIAQLAASAGYTTILYDLDKQALEKSKEGIRHQLQALADKQKISAERKKEILGKIHISSNLRDCQADVVIEAVVERVNIKMELFNRLAAINS